MKATLKTAFTLEDVTKGDVLTLKAKKIKDFGKKYGEKKRDFAQVVHEDVNYMRVVANELFDKEYDVDKIINIQSSNVRLKEAVKALQELIDLSDDLLKEWATWTSIERAEGTASETELDLLGHLESLEEERKKKAVKETEKKAAPYPDGRTWCSKVFVG